MLKEHAIVAMVQAAQTDTKAADELIMQYLPYIKSETARVIGHFPKEGEDELSISMFAFYEAAMAYQKGKGSFLKLAALSIKNRLIDYHRKEKRHFGSLSLDTPSSAEDERSLGDQIADTRDEYELLHSQAATQQEILEYTEQLAGFGLALTDIADNCPKQERTLSACMQALDYARSRPVLLEQLVSSRKLPLAQLADGAGVERKTLERHRKYLVAVLLAYTNGFEIIRGHLQRIKRKEEVQE